MKKTVEIEYKFFLGLSVIFGILTAFSLYKNDAGIAYPFLIITFLCEFYLGNIRLGRVIKKNFLYYALAMLLLAISICTTDDKFVQFMDKLGILILIGMFTVQQNYTEKNWEIFSCIKQLGELALGMIIEMGSPISHLIRARKKKEKQSEKGKQIFIGILIGLPFVFLIVILLAMADQMFGKVFLEIIRSISLYPIIIELCFLILIGIWFFYTLFVSGEHKEAEKIKEEKENAPLIAITFLSMFIIVYFLFCGIQIIYLFAGGLMKQPDNFGYAEYARRGFFELLFVSLLNFFIVTVCIKKFRDNGILRILLTIFSGCTFILIISSAYRMILYIRVYHLTFLRVLVLWFLIILTVWMVGAVWQIHSRKFLLFRYIFITSFCLYIGYAFMGESKIIVQYNLSQTERSLMSNEIEDVDFAYLVNFSNCDIAPILLEYRNTQGLTREEERMLKGYFQNIITQHQGTDLRKYNFSKEKAYQTAISYFKLQS